MNNKPSDTPRTEAINKMAMYLVGDLQMIPVEQAYDKVKEYLNNAWERGADEQSKRATAQLNEFVKPNPP